MKQHKIIETFEFTPIECKYDFYFYDKLRNFIGFTFRNIEGPQI